MKQARYAIKDSFISKGMRRLLTQTHRFSLVDNYEEPMETILLEKYNIGIVLLQQQNNTKVVELNVEIRPTCLK